jgi:Mrp family chromosome partitioning ATPase
VKSEGVASVAAKALRGSWTSTRVLHAITIRPRGQTNVIELIARAGSPRVAADLANAYAHAVVDTRRDGLNQAIDRQIRDTTTQLGAVRGPGVTAAAALQERLNELRLLRATGDPTLALAQDAEVPTGATGAPRWLVVPLAALAGAVLGVAAAVVVDLSGVRKVMSEREVVELFPMPVLARTPLRRRRFRRDRGVTDSRVRTAFTALQIRLELGQVTPRSIMITSPSRGDGRTTCAVNLAAVLAQGGRRVILVDLDKDNPELAARIATDDVLRSANGARRVLFPGARHPGQPEPPVYHSGPGLPGSLPLLQPSSTYPSVLLLDVNRLLSLSEAIDGRQDVMDALRQAIAASAGADYVVVLDVPPTSEMTDEFGLMSEVDVVLVAVQIGHTSVADTEAARDFFAMAGREPTGAVLVD